MDLSKLLAPRNVAHAAYDAETLITERTDLGSDNDGTGSGADATSGSGAVVSVAGGTEVAVCLFLGEAAATAAVGSETLDVIIEGSPDGGSTWDPLVTFRTITASTIINGSDLDESAGDPTFRRAQIVHLPRPDAGQSELTQVRANITASTTGHWAVHIDLRDPKNIRDTWLQDAVLI